MKNADSSVMSRVGPLGVVAVVWVAIAILFPTTEPGQQTSAGSTGGVPAAGSAGLTAPGGVAPDAGSVAAPAGTGAAASAAVAPAPTTGVTAGAGQSAAAATASGGAPAPAPTAGSASGGAVGAPAPTAAANAGGGNLTRDGRVCEPGVRQIPVSTYATNCQPVFTGDNGGATWKGVNAEEIIIVERRFPETANSAAVAGVSEQAGVASAEQNDEVWEVFKAYMNENFELYGRTITWVNYESQFGDSTNEAQSKGREEACLDADVVANEIGAFAVVGTRGGAVSGPFAECAAERGVVVLNGAAYFPEKFYADRHPFVWAYTMECERISYQVAEYIGKRLGHNNAQWAGDPLFQRSPRKWGVYVPNNDAYQYCVDINDRALAEYGVDVSSRYNYTLDVSRFPDEAARGAVQFKADGVTSMIMAFDPISAIFLTQAATKQAWFPEWVLIGVAATDTDLYASLYDQQNVEGSLFGLSQLGKTEDLVGPESEPGHLYEFITGEKMYDGATGGYINLMVVYNLLQQAGPNLNPAAIGAGALTIPPGGAPDYPYGYFSFADGVTGIPGAGDHTAVDDSREIYWDADALTYHETYGGQRFRNGEWPAENPPIYPEG